MHSAVSFLYTSWSEGGGMLLQFQLPRPSFVSSFLACCVSCT